MINLLPISGIKRIISEYRIRLLTTALIMLAVTMVIAIVLLFPAYLLASHKRTVVLEDLSKVGDQKASSQETKDLEKIIKETDATLDVLSGKGQTFSISSDILTKTAGFRTENIKITGIFYDKNSTEGALSLKGSAVSRQSLTDFIEMLKKDLAFRDVSLPISDLVKDRNIDFTIIIKLKGDKQDTAQKTPPQNDESR
jgi:Tfp pilus assembly protein PilN